MTSYVGTVSRGIIAPIFRQGDDLSQIIPELLITAAKEDGFEIKDRDVLAITESIVARTQGNYATTEDIAADVRTKTNGAHTIGLTFPILSRNRFSVLLKGIAKACAKVVIQLSLPSDEVGNHLLDPELLVESNINPWTETLTEADFVKNFGESKHPFTGINYYQFYRELVEAAGAECEIIFANNVKAIVDKADAIITCDIHTRARHKKLLRQATDKIVLGLDDILTTPAEGRGHNPEFGLLGSNKADDDKVKLFPYNSQPLVDAIAKRLHDLTGKHVEVMIYGDGAFKDPVGKIWELADPVVSPAYTKGLDGTPFEMKLKYLADSEFKDLNDQELAYAIYQKIKDKHANADDSHPTAFGGETEKMEGTTPRRLTDLLGSLCDLTSGSGDKGTPIVYIQGYFNNWSDAQN